MDAHRRFRADPASVPAAREFVASTVGRWCLTGGVEVACLLTSELVTNAVLHAEGDLEVHVGYSDERLRIEVVDRDPSRVPTPLPHTGDDLAGLGLHLVQSLADAWGVAPVTGGKSVWFEVVAAAG